MIIEVEGYNLVQTKLLPLHREAVEIMQTMRELKLMEKKESDKLFTTWSAQKKRLSAQTELAKTRLSAFFMQLEAVDASIMSVESPVVWKLPTSSIGLIVELNAMVLSFRGYRDFWVLRDSGGHKKHLWSFVEQSSAAVLQNYAVIMDTHKESMEMLQEHEYYYTENIVQNRSVGVQSYQNLEHLRTTLIHDLVNTNFEQKDQLRYVEKAMRETREYLDESYALLEKAYRNQGMVGTPKLRLAVAR